jgi:L-asparaginase
MKQILLIYTGGTIGMARDAITGALVPLNFDRLSAAIPELNLLECNTQAISIAEPIDSSDMHPGLWVELAQLIQTNYTRFDGFVLLHGSDTMAYTASALSFLLENLSKPVILTGSQLPVGILRSDARENLISSIELALATHPNGQPLINEVAIYFEYKLYRGNRTYKNSSSNFEAFQSPNYPWLAEMGTEVTINYSALLPPSNQPLVVHQRMNTEVAVLPLFPGFNPKIIYKLAEADLRGLILRTFGAGNAPTDNAFLEAVQWCIKRDITLVNISQCRAGTVNQNKYAAGKSLATLGVIGGKDLTLEAAVTKLMYLLAKPLNLAETAATMGKSLRGELSE